MRWGDTLLEVVRADEFAVDGTPLVAGGEAVAAPAGTVGPISYELRSATAVEPLPAPRGDRRVVPYIAAAAAVHVAAVMCALAIPEVSHRADVAKQATTRRARITAAPSAHEEEGADDRGHAAQGHGRAMDGDAGAIGAPTKTPAAGQITIANTGELPQLSRAEAIERARHAGILGSTRISPDAFASLVGHDPLTSGFDEHSAEAARADGATGGGGFGFSRTGFGTGGGGTSGITGWGTIGTAHSDGTSFGHGWGGRGQTRSDEWSRHWDGGDYAIIPTRNHHYESHLAMCDGDLRDKCVVDGELAPRVVRHYMKRNSARLEYCFEKDQLERPGTRTVVVTFVIDTTVQSATAAGAHDDLDTCIADVVRSIEFPKGPTHVAYYLRYHRPDAGSTDRADLRVREQ